MPPIRRETVGNRRRDAAFDAMHALGFSDDLIRKELNKLLKVYGHDGWSFIEANCYLELVEALLRNENETLPNPNPKPTQDEAGSSQQNEEMGEKKEGQSLRRSTRLVKDPKWLKDYDTGKNRRETN